MRVFSVMLLCLYCLSVASCDQTSQTKNQIEKHVSPPSNSVSSNELLFSVSPSSIQAPLSETAQRSRIVKIEPKQLKRLTDINDQGSISINLFKDLVIVSHFKKRQRNDSGSTTWIGSVAQHPNSQVLLVVRENQINGTVALSGIGNFSIQSLESGNHLIVQLKDLNESTTDTSDILEPPLTQDAGQ